jgi:hypothetical protein
MLSVRIENKEGREERNQVLNDVDLDKLVLYDSPDVQVEFAYLPDLKESHNLSEKQGRHRIG